MRASLVALLLVVVACATPSTEPLVEFGDGTWTVGSEIAPGSYQSSGGSDCHWEIRDTSSVIEEGRPVGIVTVEIPGEATEFFSEGCGDWDRRRSLISDLEAGNRHQSGAPVTSLVPDTSCPAPMNELLEAVDKAMAELGDTSLYLRLDADTAALETWQAEELARIRSSAEAADSTNPESSELAASIAESTQTLSETTIRLIDAIDAGSQADFESVSLLWLAAVTDLEQTAGSVEICPSDGG